MKQFIFIFLSLTLLASCGKIKNKTKNTINKGGEVIGKSATEFVDGLGDGVEQSASIELQIDENLQPFFETGVYSVKNQSEGSRNQLSLYLIHKKDISKEILLKAYNEEEQEIGRAKLEIANKEGNAAYYDFLFDPRTRLTHKGKIVISSVE